MLEKIELIKVKNEMTIIKRWLNTHDFMINKYMLGEYKDTDEKWVNYLKERKDKLKTYNELEKVVANGTI